MNPPSEDIKDLLEDGDSSSDDIGTFNATTGWSIKMSEMSTSPDTCILVSDGPSWGSPNPNYSYEYPTIQIQVRGEKGSYLTAYAKAEEIKNFLNGNGNQTVNGARYIQITCSSDILYLGRDENQRPLFSINFELQRTEGSA